MKIITAIVATLLMMVAAFAYPIFFNWYVKTYLGEASDILPAMLSVYMWVGIFCGVVLLWSRALSK